MLYFDHNATAPLHPAARDAWLAATERFPGNPSSLHRVGARADAALSQARQQLAARLGCDALDLVFTSGATESANTVFHHAARTLPPDAEVWLSAIEHPCVTAAAKHYFPNRHRLLPVTRDGVLDLKHLRAQLPSRRAERPSPNSKLKTQNSRLPALLAVMAVNNETGILQPWREALALARAHGIPFFCDAVQALGKLPAAGLGDCDWVSGSAHKFGGPRGVGFLKCPAQGRVEPLLRGGSQEEARRAGTENVPGILAMVAALELREREGARTPTSAAAVSAEAPATDEGVRAPLRDTFERQLRKALPGTKIIGAKSPRVWNTTLALLPEVDCRTRWVVKLDKLGVATSTGSACASGKEEPSPVLTAMGYTASEAARALRFSAGWETTAVDWEQLLAALVQAHREMRPQ